MAEPGLSSAAPSRPRRRFGWGRRALFVFLSLAWVFVVWRALAPPLPLGLEGYRAPGMVELEGGRIPALSLGLVGVEVPPFRIDRFEVTEGEFARFIAAHKHERPPYHWGGRTPPPGTEDLPVVHVDLHQARRYAAWLGKRIPTVGEWELAARGIEGRVFPWGLDVATVRANTLDAGLGGRSPVGFFPAGVARDSGCHDLVGNVKEWTDSPASPGDRRFFVRGGSFVDPLRRDGWSILDAYKGGFKVEEEDIVQARWAPMDEALDTPGSHSSDLGFRCAMSEEEFEARRVLWDRIGGWVQDLAARDPISVWLRAWPAQRALIDAGYPALAQLRIASRAVEGTGVQARVEATIAAIETRVGLR